MSWILRTLIVLFDIRLIVGQGVRLNEDCRETTEGWEYIGTQSVTDKGIACQVWTATSPHFHIPWQDYAFPEGNADAASNYCRNPYGMEDEPWCYTTNPKIRWQPCGIPMCAGFEAETFWADEEVDAFGNKVKKTFVIKWRDRLLFLIYHIPVLGTALKITIRFLKRYRLTLILFIIPVILLTCILIGVLLLYIVAYFTAGQDKAILIKIPQLSEEERIRLAGQTPAGDNDDLF